MKGKIVYFLTIVICFLLQCTVMDLISIGSVTPNLMLVFCVSMGLMRGRKSGPESVFHICPAEMVVLVLGKAL